MKDNYNLAVRFSFRDQVFSKERWFMKFSSCRFFNVLLILSFLQVSFIHSVKAQQNLTTIDGWNAYVHLPDDYVSTTVNYPLIVFIPGIGEIGTNPAKLLIYGPSYFIAQGHPMQFTVNGVLEKPIVISLQPVTAWPGPTVLNRKLDSIIKRWRVDIDRISVTGLSMGGWSWENMVTLNTTNASRISSMVIMSAPEPDNGISNMRYFAQTGGKWWGFEGTQDPRRMNEIRDTMNFYNVGSARYTLYNGGHCCWNTWYNPTYTENGDNIYQWMLKFRRGVAVNLPPIAKAGADFSITLPQNSAILNGRSSIDPDGWIVTHQWTKISGGAVTILSPALDTTIISGLSEGVYSFSLKVTDNKGTVALDTVEVSVKPPVPVNVPPQANAGPDRTIQFPDNSVLLQGSGTDADGTIAAIAWSFVSGPFTPSITNLTNGAGRVTELRPGIYTFKLTVTDNKGAIAFDEVAITVKGREVEGIFPNPVKDQFILTRFLDDNFIGDLQLLLYDASGKLIMKKLVQPAQKGWWSERFILPAKSHPAALYFLKIQSGSGNLKTTVYPILRVLN